MKRLVYSPSVNVWVKSDFGVVDLSPYVTECSITRKINEVSSAKIVFRNPKVESGPAGSPRFLFTEHNYNDGSIGPVFHPMDPIIITMTRIKGRPVQVFTGYCDTTPYVQLYPGLATIEASCTLKRLLHTYWDPGLIFVTEFMQQYGWGYNPKDGTSIMANDQAENTPKLNDTGVGVLLGAMLNEVGGWEKDDILIQPLPSDAIQKQVGKIFDQLVQSGKDGLKQYTDYMSEFVNAASAIGGPATSSSAPGSSNAVTFPPGTGIQVGASEFHPEGGDAGGAFGGAGTQTPDGTIPGGNPPPRGGVNHGYWFGETSTNWQSSVPDSALNFSALGNLRYGTPVQVTYKGKSVIARKADVGRGGPNVGGKPRAIDLWVDTAEALGFPGLDVVTVKVLTEQMVKDIRRGQ